MIQWYFVAALLTILTSSQGILTTLSQSNGGYKYDYATIPFLAEVFKLLVSSVLLWREWHASPPPRMTTEWKSVRLFPIPSIIYLIHNNVQFATLTYVDTSTYQIMGNLKIVTTGILFRLFLRRKLSNLQWMAIVLLAIGTTTSQVKGCGEVSCNSIFSAPIQGYMLGILSACLSALAGVYTEFLMKKNNDSLYWQNIQLYTFGAIFNMARLLLDDFRGGFENGPWWQRLFNGYNATTWMVVLNLGSTGLLVSWLMKYADNIVKDKLVESENVPWKSRIRSKITRLKNNKQQESTEDSSLMVDVRSRNSATLMRRHVDPNGLWRLFSPSTHGPLSSIFHCPMYILAG